MNRTHTFAVSVLAVSLVVANATCATAGEKAKTELTILHTSDLHGAVMPFNDYANRPSDRGSLAQISTMVTEIRQKTAHPVLLLDSGDTLQGTPFEQFTHVRWGDPSPTIAAMNSIGYDAMAIGNHEFNFGLEVLERAREQAEFPFLSANSLKLGTDQPAYQPYAIFERGPLRVGVLGLTTPGVPGWEKPENYRGLEFAVMDEAARRWVPVLLDREKCDVIIVIAHTGFEHDPDTGESSRTEHEDFAWRLTQVPGIDVLLTGHTHEDIPPRMVNGVFVSQPWARARALTRIDLELSRTDTGWQVVHRQGENFAARGVPADSAITREFTLVQQRVQTALDGPIGEVTGDVRVDRCRLEDCAAVDLLHEVQMHASGAELSLAALLNTGAPALKAGPVNWRWIHGFYVYPNTLMAVRLNGAQIRDVLEHAARYYDGLECGADGCTVIGDAEIPHYNVDNMAGVTYRIDPTEPEGSRIKDLRHNGLPIDPEAEFVVAINSYRAASGGFYPHLEDAEVVWRSSEEVADLIGDYLNEHRPWRPVVDGNWRIGRDLVAEE